MTEKQKCFGELQKQGKRFAVLTDPSNITYAGGFEVPFWPAFMGDVSNGLPMVTVLADAGEEKIYILASDYYKSRLERAGIEHCFYFRSFTHTAADIPEENYKKAFRGMMQEAGVAGKKDMVGIEKNHIPVILYSLLLEYFEKEQIGDASPALENARRIKTDRELRMLKEAALAADAAQERLYQISREEGDYTELDIWFEVQKAVCRQTGCLTPFVGELVTGPRTGLSDYPLGPSDRKIQKGDAAIMDISPRVNGYWADCSNVVVFWREADEEQRRYFEAVKSAYDAGREAIKPGAAFLEVNQAMEKAYKKHGFELCSYLGHQIGCNVNEKPRFTQYDTSVLEEDMVVCIEPQLYSGCKGKTGVRLERMLHVTKTGNEELNHFTWGI